MTSQVGEKRETMQHVKNIWHKNTTLLFQSTFVRLLIKILDNMKNTVLRLNINLAEICCLFVV